MYCLSLLNKNNYLILTNCEIDTFCHSKNHFNNNLTFITYFEDENDHKIIYIYIIEKIT